MRSIGRLTDGRQAATFVDYLLTLGINAKAERSTPAAGAATPSDDVAWELWVFDEDRLAKAKETLQEFRAEPEAERFTSAGKAAEKLRRAAVDKELEFRRAQRSVERAFGRTSARRPVTMTLLVASCLVFVLTDGVRSKSEDGAALAQRMRITEITPVGDDTIRFDPTLPEVREGQWWRLVSPMLLHFSWMHLIFNMMCLIDFGTQVETLRGSLKMLLFTLLFAAVGNVVQYLFRGPGFGGMSGVGYGLFGYVWMKATFEPGSGFVLRPLTVFFLVGWFLFGIYGEVLGVGNTANFCHGVGLVLGVVLGYAPTFFRSLRGRA